MAMNETRVLQNGPREMNYLLFTPQNGVTADLPLAIYLHGAGERGKQIEHVCRHGVPELIRAGREYPAIVLCPQCPAGYVWDNLVAELKELIDRIVTQFSVKADRIVLTGSSMGGYGTFSTALTYGNFFAGIAPVAGGGMGWRATRLRTTPVYAFHGDKDQSVLCENSRQMVQAVNNCGGQATLTVLPDMGHNDGIDYAYAHTDLMDWLLARRRTDFTYVPDLCEGMF